MCEAIATFTFKGKSMPVPCDIATEHKTHRFYVLVVDEEPELKHRNIFEE